MLTLGEKLLMPEKQEHVKEIHAALERIRQLARIRDSVVETLTRKIEAEQEHIRKMELS